jgi:hypothetical protein
VSKPLRDHPRRGLRKIANNLNHCLPAGRRKRRQFCDDCRNLALKRRAAELGTRARIGCNTFRATGITAYLEAGGTLENAQAMAAHESPRITKLYDRTGVSLRRRPSCVRRVLCEDWCCT